MLSHYADEDNFQISFRRNMNGDGNLATIAYFLTWIGTACWVVCFWWMHRISAKQETMLKELSEVIKRIEKLSKAEHDLIREVHPKVEEIKASVKDVSDAVSSEKR